MPDFDPNTPSIARVYDYFVGGKDNFATDRDLAERLIEALPSLLPTVVENKDFLARAVTWTANQGITQFIDVGCGMPTSPTTDEVARGIHADARVAYIDNDPVVVSHLGALLAHGNPGVTVVDGDVRDVPGILARVAEGVDLSEPVCLIMGALLHFFSVPGAQDLVTSYVAALAPGSYVVLTMGLVLGERGDAFFRTYMADGPTKLYQHDADEFASFFGPLEMVGPGVGDGRTVRPGWAKVPVPPERDCTIIVGIARVTG
ncbi:MAG TPA: SAM-dependent methyltransferase [Trebonia sp.]|nr:SAM-dependent methyltransferase [Trebonia sp.]